MTVPVDRPLEEWAVSRALFPTRLIQERCARKKEKKKKNNFSLSAFQVTKCFRFQE